MTKVIFGLVKNVDQARQLVDNLLAAGFSNQDISILYPNRGTFNNANDNEIVEEGTKRKKFKTEERSKAPEGGVAGATTGGILGGSLGLLAGIGAIAIPGLGAFIAAGPIMAALGGSAVGGSLGLLIGSLVGYGIPEYEAKKYEENLKAGNILISVHTENDQELSRANEIMKKSGARDISSTSQKTKIR